MGLKGAKVWVSTQTGIKYKKEKMIYQLYYIIYLVGFPEFNECIKQKIWIKEKN